MKLPNLWLIGSGSMGEDYAKVLKSMDVSFRVVGRGNKSSSTFTKNTGVEVIRGGIDNALSIYKCPNLAIVAVDVDQLAVTTERLINEGCKSILVEKPGGLTLSEISKIAHLSEKSCCRVFVAYNRRFYSSILKLKELALSEGGICSATIEFTEWSNIVSAQDTSDKIKENWILANSSHVLDLAFNLIGLPAEEDWNAWVRGSLGWHKRGAQFCGAGVSEQGILFSYHADWDSAGRWGLDIYTKSSQYILRPLEKLQRVAKDTIEIEEVEFDMDLDLRFKPGLFLQCKAFIGADYGQLCTISRQAELAEIYSKIAGY